MVRGANNVKQSGRENVSVDLGQVSLDRYFCQDFLAAIGVFERGLGQKFDGNDPLGLDIHRFDDSAEASLANHFQ